MPVTAEWSLRPSRRQQRLNRLLLLVLAVFLLLLLPLFQATVAAGLAALLLWRPVAMPVSRLGVDAQGWWLQRQEGTRHYVQWRSGSVRRRDLVLLNWSVWPWHSLLIRRDSLGSDDDFRRLKAALYASWR